MEANRSKYCFGHLKFDRPIRYPKINVKLTVELKSTKLGRKARLGNRNLKSSAFGWFLKPKDLIRSPRETIKTEEKIESTTKL